MPSCLQVKNKHFPANHTTPPHPISPFTVSSHCLAALDLLFYFPQQALLLSYFGAQGNKKKTSWGRAQKIKHVQQELMFLPLETVWHCVWTKKDMTAATKLGFFSPLFSFGCVIKHKHNQSKDGNNYGKQKYSDSKLTHSPLRQTHKADQEAANLFDYSLDTQQSLCSATDVYDILRERVWFHMISAPFPGSFALHYITYSLLIGHPA